MSNFKKNKYGSIDSTITWAVATLVIIGVLVGFVLGSIGLSKAKEVSSLLVSDAQSDFKEESQILKTKTSIAYELNNLNKGQIDDLLKNEK